MHEVARYNIYFTKYSILANAYVKYIQVVVTDDIYREIGKLICTTLERIASVRYVKAVASREDCARFWTEAGYHEISCGFWANHEHPANDEKLYAECARVVRCKNCKFGIEVECEKDMNFFECPYSSDARDGEEFCSRGVFRENVDLE